MTYNLCQTDADLEAMLARISHDLRTPLARLRMEIEVSKLPQVARIGIDEDIAQIDYSFKQLMEYARPARAVPSVATDVSAALLELYKYESARIESSGGNLNAKLDANISAYVSAPDITVIAGNLIDNARRYGRSSDGSLAIDLSLIADKDVFLIEVSDRGCGIPPKDIARLMRPFVRGESVPRFGGDIGLGLGLAIVERRLTHVGGSLRLFNRDSGGLTARIALPREPYQPNH